MIRAFGGITSRLMLAEVDEEACRDAEILVKLGLDCCGGESRMGYVGDCIFAQS